MRQSIVRQSDMDLMSYSSATKSKSFTTSIEQSALLQVDIAANILQNKMSAILKAMDEKFAKITILLDIDLALLSTKIITPYMRESYLKEIVSKKKAKWLSKNMPAITKLTKPWSIVTTEDKSIQKSIEENVLIIKSIMASNNTFHEKITQDIKDFKEYLMSNHDITASIYKQSESRNGEDIEMYLMKRIATTQAMQIANSYTYISIDNILSNTYLNKDKLIKNLPHTITIKPNKDLDYAKKEQVSSSELNKYLYKLDLLGSIAENKSYVENSFKYFKGHAYIYSKGGNCILLNKQQSSSLGISDESYFEGKNFSDIFPQEEAYRLLQAGTKTINENETQILKEKYTYPEQGQETTFLSIKTPLRNKKNKAIGLIGFSIPMDSSKKLQTAAPENVITKIIEGNDQSIQETIKNMPGHVFWQDLDGKIMGCNHYHANFFGFERSEDLVGQFIYDFLTENYAERAKKDLKNIKTNAKPLVHEEIYKSSDGLKIMVSHKTPVKNKDNKVIGVMVIAIDISDSKQKELMIEKEKEQLEIANNFKNQFIKNIEHDVRANFVQLCSMTELYARKEKDKEKKRSIHEISNCAKGALAYCDALIDFRKGSYILNTNSTIALRDLAESISKTSMIAIRFKRLKFDLIYDDNIPNIVIGDIYRVKSILNNLMSNAVKFTDQGYIKLNIRLHSYEGDKINILFSVKDSGTGISQEIQQKVLNKHNIFRYTNRKLSARSGIGLNKVKQFVEDLRGDIEIRSSHETGTEVKIQIPFTMYDNCKEVKYFNNKINKKALIIEKSIENRKLLEKTASDLVCYSKSASSFKEAITLLENENFDLVLLDIKSTDSRALAYRIRDIRNQHIKIVMINTQNPKLNPEINKKPSYTTSFSNQINIEEITSMIENTMEPEVI